MSKKPIIHKIVTAFDKRREKWDRDNALSQSQSEAMERAARDARNAEFIKQHPQIGMLMVEGRPLYYVNFPTYKQSGNPHRLVSPLLELL